MNQTLNRTVGMLTEIESASDISSSRSFLDLWADRIRQASTETDLAHFAERLMDLMNAAAGGINPDVAADFIAVSSGEDAKRVLNWIREQPKIAALIAHVARKDLAARDEALNGVELPDGISTGQALPPAVPEIGITATCLTPLAHGSDSKAGNATLFRRMRVLSNTGSLLTLPYYAGNAVRGHVRDLLADDFLRALGLGCRRDKPDVSVWLFHVLYAGGALEEAGGPMKKISDRMGKSGKLDLNALRELRDRMPATSLLGTALGNRIVSGRVDFCDLRPRSIEWGSGERSCSDLMAWLYLTRREDLETHTDHSGMIATVETLKAGTILDGGITVSLHATDLERGALARGMELLAIRGRLGAENRRDLGGVKLEFTGLPDSGPYVAWLAENGETIREYLKTIGGINVGNIDVGASDPEI